jgi:hypothetical protein
MFKAAAIELAADPLWRYRHAMCAAAASFIISGGWALIFAHREQWIFPIVNHQMLLVAHWCLATPFLLGVLVQRLTVGRMADAGMHNTSARASEIRGYHRMVGTATLACSVGASCTALLLAPQALAAGWVFTIWALMWLFLAVQTWRTGRRAAWKAHRMWAEALSRTGLAFVVGRSFLMLCTVLGFGQDFWV